VAEESEESAVRVLEEVVEEAHLHRRPELRVYSGDPPERLTTVARGENALLTVVGSSGHGSLKSWLVGSVSRELVKSFDRPVVVVPPGASVPGRGPATRALVCGVDASDGADQAVALAARLAKLLALRLVVAHAYVPAQSVATIPAASGITVAHSEQLNSMTKRDATEVLERAAAIAGTQREAQRRLLVGDPAKRLADLAARERAAMIVVGSRGRGPLASALLGSVASALIAKAPVPVVIATDHVSEDALSLLRSNRN